MPRKQNKSFRGGHLGWANACVGDNGAPGIMDYADGFSESAKLLIEQVLATRAVTYPVDKFIYPICFSIRHAVELKLKKAVDDLTALSKYQRPIPEFDKVGTHSLLLVWRYIHEHARRVDARFITLIDEMDEYIRDIAEADETGQTFRYPNELLTDKKHLVEFAIINVVVLYKRFGELEELLQKFYSLSTVLIDEYEQGSYTSKLSRHQLFKVGIDLTDRDKWGTDEFKANKQFLQEKYGLSSRDHCKALVIIQNHYEMSGLINQQKQIDTISFEKLLVFFDGWAELHDIEKIKFPGDPTIINLDSEDLLDEWMSSMKSDKAAYDKVAAALEASEMATIQTLFYFARSMRYSEQFQSLFEIYSEEVGDTGTEAFRQSVMHILDKTNALENILNSLNMLNQDEMVNRILDRYTLQAYRDRLMADSNAIKARRDSLLK